MSKRLPVVTIDGPVAAGKSTVARELARELGYIYVSTGAMYRAVAVAVREAGITLDDSGELLDRLRTLLAATDISVEAGHVTLNRRDPGALLNAPGIDELASRLSALAPVREKMRALQRRMALSGAVVMEGRDIGTVIFPEAQFKFFLDAQPRIRAQRRFTQLTAAGIRITLDEVLQQLLERDQRDSSREIAPLKPAPDAIVIDSSALSVEAVVQRMKAVVVGSESARRS
jgi:cytidylate kinase